MRIGGLFSGIGGLELGLERAGVGHTVWQVEKDPYCRAVLARHWPDVPQYEDVTCLDWSALEHADIVCGGFPCQPFSIAGLQRGVLDERWMWPAFADCIRVVRPRYVVVENVTDLIADGDAFGRVLADLHECGFDADWSVVPACAVGAPHARERVFLLAYRPDGHVADQVSSHRREATRPGEPRGSRRSTGRDGWLPEPAMDRVAHGLPLRLVRDPLHALGNAVVPQVAEYVGRRLLELHVREAAA